MTLFDFMPSLGNLSCCPVIAVRLGAFSDLSECRYKITPSRRLAIPFCRFMAGKVVVYPYSELVKNG